MKTIYFDMDGTIANFYSVEGWLNYLINRDTTPYEVAKPMMNMNSLARILNNLQRKGYEIGIVSWLSKNSTTDFDKEVTEAKIKWLSTHLKSVKFNEIHIVAYGTPKQNVVKNPQGILFDDEEHNRKEWCGEAYNVQNIIEILKGLE